MNPKKNKVPQQGRPLKDPAAGKRKMVSLKLNPKTHQALREIAALENQSQSEIVDEAIKLLRKKISRRNGLGRT